MPYNDHVANCVCLLICYEGVFTGPIALGAAGVAAVAAMAAAGKPIMCGDPKQTQTDYHMGSMKGSSRKTTFQRIFVSFLT